MREKGRRGYELSERKRAILEALMREEGVEGEEVERIRRRERRGGAGLSYAQQRLWFFDQFEPHSSVYNLVNAVSLKGQLDVAALERAFNEVVQRHEALRTTFGFEDGQPVQIIAPSQPVGLQVVNLMHLAESEREIKVKGMINKEAQRPFNLAKGPLLRVTLIRLKDAEHVLLLAMHHIVSDAWSLGIFVNEIVSIYEAFSKGQPSPLPELPIQYADFAVWQREWLKGEVLEGQLDYWKKKLAGNLPVLDLPTDRSHPALQTYNGASITFPLSPSLSQSLKALSQAEEATLFMTLLAAYKILLYRYTGQEDIVVGTPIANRNRWEIEGLIGFFTNTLVLRTDLSGNPNFRELLGRVHEVALSAYAHQDLPFEKLVEELHPSRDLSHSPLAQIIFAMRNASEYTIEIPGLSVNPMKGEVATAKFDLTLYIDDLGRELEGTFEYNTDLFNRDTIVRMIGHFVTLLEGVLANPQEHISSLPLLTEAEKRQLLIESNDTQTDYPKDKCAHHLFEAQVECTPNAAAVLFEDEQITYRELNARANQVAHYLQSLGAGDLVGIFMDRSFEMIVGVLGILKAGAACLPLDPSYPKERLEFMIEDAQAKVVLSQRRLAKRLPEPIARIVCLDDCEAITRASGENPQTSVTPESLVYVIYTSGSTGKPKGVAMPHRSLVNLAEWHQTLPSRSTRTLQFASLNFDVSFQEMFSTWHEGGTLLMIKEPVRIDIPALGQLIERYSVQRFHLPVVVLQKLAEEFSDKPQALSSLRELMVGGEQLQITAPVIRLFTQLKDCVLYNHYGPSESHVVTSFLLPGEPASWPALPPLGRPISNTQIYLLDSHLQPVPVGVPGEVYIGGVCLAHGYLRRPDLTAERFIPNPFSNRPGERLYKTGDLARFLPDRLIVFLGRNDFQVKIRGYRIEPGEIEAALRQHPSVRDAVAVALEDGAGREKRIAGYIVAEQQQQPTAKQLREHLRQLLPEYMIPSRLVWLESLPLTPSGKLDRGALPRAEKASPDLDGETRAAATPLEEVLVGIWSEVLGVEEVGVDDNFFDLGGHSLLATQVASRVREALEVEVGVRKLFERPTVAGLAEAMVEEVGERVERMAEMVMKLSEMTEEEAEGMVERREKR